MRREVNSIDELREIVGHPNTYVTNKVGKRLSTIQRDWLAHSPLGFVATTDAQGRVDVSPKGDPPGLVHVIDDTMIAIPERPGNKRVMATSTFWSGRMSARCSSSPVAGTRCASTEMRASSPMPTTSTR
jgi:predicted pyridoxine 5'-phosphate oxidase superfamily flavin-nucleotide-binding protein